MILDTLNDKQAQAVQSITGETLVIAGAGSGKTAVLTRRCAFLISQGARPGSILSVTFTNKAAQEMNHRIRKLLTEVGINIPFQPPWVADYTMAPLFCTFHSLGVRLLREYGHELDVKKEFNILDSDDQQKLIKLCQKELNIDPKVMPPKYASSFISLCKQELLLARDSSQVSRDYLPIFHEVYKLYEKKCIENQVVDFDDLILKSYLLLKNFPSVRQELQNRWEHIQVDEFQDINQAQFQLIKLLYEPV
jgi:DNA helicase II / ATP-dependent DNA helicase PcrA